MSQNRSDYAEFIRNVVYNDPSKILLFKQKYLTDEMWEMAIDQEADLFKYVKNPSPGLCQYALSADGMNIRYIKDGDITPKMVAIALNSNPNALDYVPEDMMEPEDDFYTDIGKTKQLTPEELIYRKPNSIKNMEHPSEDLICLAIKLDPMIYLYYNDHTPRMKQIIEEYYPNLTSLFPGFDD